MSPATLGLTILGATAASTGVGIAVINLTNANNESIEEKIEKSWEEVMKNFNYLNTRITKIQQDKNLAIKYAPILAKIVKIAETENSTTQNSTTTYTLKSYKNPQEIYTKLQNINQELQEIIKSLN